MAEEKEDLYETRTMALGSDNMISSFWKHTDHNSFPFKPENAVNIETEALSSVRFYGKEILDSYDVSKEDVNNASLKGKKEYFFDLCSFKTYALDKSTVSSGILALVYPADRSVYNLFLIQDSDIGRKKLQLLLKVKQKVALFGSFTNDMITYF